MIFLISYVILLARKLSYSYFITELDKLDITSLEDIYENVQVLLAKKRSAQNDSNVNQAEDLCKTQK